MVRSLQLDFDTTWNNGSGEIPNIHFIIWDAAKARKNNNISSGLVDVKKHMIGSCHCPKILKDILYEMVNQSNYHNKFNSSALLAKLQKIFLKHTGKPLFANRENRVYEINFDKHFNTTATLSNNDS